MPLTPIAGVSRLRAYQMGKESTFKTQVAATRRFPWSFAPTVDPHWTTPTADTGTLDPALPPYRMGGDYTGQATGALAANDAPYLWSALLKGGVTPTAASGADTWHYVPASTSQDTFDTFTAEWSDDATGDGFAYTGGVLDRLQLQYPQDGGPIQVTADWRFADVVYPSAPTGSLNVDLSPTWLYATDTALYIDSVAGSIGITQLTNTMYDGTVTINNNLDIKRFANGSNARFQVANYGRGARLIEATFTFAKSSAAITEATDWLNANATERFLVLDTVSTATAGTGSAKYQQKLKFAGYWFTRSDPTVNSNTAIQLVCHGVYDSTLAYPIDVTVVNTLSAL